MPPKLVMEFHVHTNASLLAMGALLAQNVKGKSDQLVVYAYRLFNNAKQNYNTTKRKTLAMVSTLHISLGIICWETSLCFMLIIWL
jgi:hypothetical protein